MGNSYSLSEFIKTAYSLIMTKLTFPGARLLRRPIYIRGRRSISGADGLTTGRFCRFDLDGAEKTLFIGRNCEFGDNTHIVALNRVEIGDNVLIASKVFISDTNHGNYDGPSAADPAIPPNERELVSTPVKIGNNVWIGENTVILAGSMIGDGCIIGANSVIKGVFPAGSMIVDAGKVIKTYNSEKGKWIRIKNE